MSSQGGAVLFDLDNTLHDRDAGLLDFIRAQHAELGLGSRGVPLDEWTGRFVRLDAGGKVWKDAVYAGLCREFDLPDDPGVLLAGYEARFASYVRPTGDLPAMLRALRASGWRTGIVSNGRSSFQRRTLAALEIEPLLDTVVISEEVALRKPDPRIFRLALSRVGCEPRGSWFVGDDPVADVEGAKAAELNAILYNRNGLFAADGISLASRIGDLPQILGQPEP